jgi:hypothetical protein
MRPGALNPAYHPFVQTPYFRGRWNPVLAINESSRIIRTTILKALWLTFTPTNINISNTRTQAARNVETKFMFGK